MKHRAGVKSISEQCSACQHPLDNHHQVNDHNDCTDFYVDPVTDDTTFCTCVRTCCFEERCPGWSENHVCCVCVEDDPRMRRNAWVTV